MVKFLVNSWFNHGLKSFLDGKPGKLNHGEICPWLPCYHGLIYLIPIYFIICFLMVKSSIQKQVPNVIIYSGVIAAWGTQGATGHRWRLGKSTGQFRLY
jgi:ABC-type transport system involved in cytochrome c biogenesis permease subunit